MATYLQYLLQSVQLALWLIVIPYCIGLLPGLFSVRPAGRGKPGVTLLYGYIIMLALFEIIAIIVTINVTYGGLTALSAWFTPPAIAMAAAGLGGRIVAGRAAAAAPCATASGSMPRSGPAGFIRSLRETAASLPWDVRIIWVLFFLVLGFQLFMAVTRASFDGDDAFYVVQSLVAWQNDTLYRVDPYTGVSTAMKMRSALAAFPLWIAFIADKAGLHPTIVAHSIMPLCLIPLSYLVYLRIGVSLCRRRAGTLPLFMVFIALLQMFGNVSIYTNETFLLTRTWQGKSFAANFIIPAAWWLFLVIGEIGEAGEAGETGEEAARDGGRGGGREWVILAVLTFTAAIASSLAVMLVLIFAAAFGIFMAAGRRDAGYLVKTALACAPGAAFVLWYVWYAVFV